VSRQSISVAHVITHIVSARGKRLKRLSYRPLAVTRPGRSDFSKLRRRYIPDYQ
jgi:hypothetical protein